MVHIKVQLDEGAELPKRAHDNDTGYDLKALSYKLSEPSEYLDALFHDDFLYDCSYNKNKMSWFGRIFSKFMKLPNFMRCTSYSYVVVETGVHVQPEQGYWTMAVPNSRVGKRPYWLGNSVGIIDEGYTGSIKFVYKLSREVNKHHIDSYFSKGNVIGQLIVMKRYDMEIEQVDKLEDTVRGDGGFGSTENKK